MVKAVYDGLRSQVLIFIDSPVTSIGCCFYPKRLPASNNTTGIVFGQRDAAMQQYRSTVLLSSSVLSNVSKQQLRLCPTIVSQSASRTGPMPGPRPVSRRFLSAIHPPDLFIYKNHRKEQSDLQEEELQRSKSLISPCLCLLLLLFHSTLSLTT